MSSQFLKSILGKEKSLEVTEPRYVSGSEIDESLKKLSDYENLTAVAIVPVLFEGKTVAILSLGSLSHDEIPTTDRHTLEAISIQVGAYMARVKAQESIILSQSEMMAMFDSLQDLFFIIDRTGLVLHANTTASTRLATDDTTLKGKSILDFYDKKNRTKISRIFKKVKHGEVIKLDYPLVAVDNNRIQTSTRVVKGEYSGEDVLFVVSREKEN